MPGDKHYLPISHWTLQTELRVGFNVIAQRTGIILNTWTMPVPPEVRDFLAKLQTDNAHAPLTPWLCQSLVNDIRDVMQHHRMPDKLMEFTGLAMQEWNRISREWQRAMTMKPARVLTLV